MMRFRGPLEPGWHHPGWYELLGWLLPTLFFIALVALVVWAVIRLTESGRLSATAGAYSPWAPRADAALEQVRIRYARGEISRDEFVQLSGDLGAPPGEPGSPPDQVG
jgi:putative membrane protein